MRLRRLGEALHILRALFSRERVSFEGEHYRIRNAGLYPPPPCKVPILVAVAGPQAVRLETPSTQSRSDLRALANSPGFGVEEHAFGSETNGECSHALRRIRIETGLAPGHRVKTLALELAHATPHAERTGRGLMELEAVVAIKAAGTRIQWTAVTGEPRGGWLAWPADPWSAVALQPSPRSV